MQGRIIYGLSETRYELDGKIVSKEEFFEVVGKTFAKSPSFEPPSVSGNWSRPVLSDALSVHASEVPLAQKQLADKGVPTEFTKDGRPILTSRAHRRRVLKALGYHDRNGGYSD